MLNEQISYQEQEFLTEIELVTYLKKFFMYSKQRDAYFFICQNSEEWHQRGYRVQNLDQAIHEIFQTNRENIYCSTSVHNANKRTEETTTQLPALILDLDYYKTKFKDLSFDDIIEKLTKKYFNKGLIPYPNAVTSSGGGAYLIWWFKYTPSNEGILTKRRVVMKILYEMLKDFGADAKSLDAAHVFRIPSTINVKGGERKLVKTYVNGLQDYTLAEFARALPSLWDVWKKKKKIKIDKDKPNSKRKKSKFASLDPEKTLSYDYIQTAFQLVTIRNGECDGYREMFIFFVRNYYHGMYSSRFYKQDEKLFEESLALASELNDKFTNPLKDKELETQTLNKSKLYRFKVETFYDWFDVTLEEKIQLKVKSKEAKNEKSKRQMRELREARGVIKREEYLEQEQEKTADKLWQLKQAIERHPEYNNKQLAEYMKVSSKTIQRLKKKL